VRLPVRGGDSVGVRSLCVTDTVGVFDAVCVNVLVNVSVGVLDGVAPDLDSVASLDTVFVIGSDRLRVRGSDRVTVMGRDSVSGWLCVRVGVGSALGLTDADGPERDSLRLSLEDSESDLETVRDTDAVKDPVGS